MGDGEPHGTRTASLTLTHGGSKRGENDRLKSDLRYRFTTKVDFRALSLQRIQISPPMKS